MISNQKSLIEVNRIVSKSPVIVFVWKNQPGWPVAFVSNNVEKWLGYTAEDFFSGRVLYADIVHPDDIKRVGEEVSRYSSEKKRIDFAHIPYRIITRDGKVKWFDDRTNIRRDRSGNITHYEGVLIDITEIIQAEELLKENEKKLKSFSYNVPGMIYSGNKDWSVRAISNSEMVCGYSSEEFLDNKINWTDLIHPDDREMVYDQGDDFLIKPTSIVQEYRILTKQGLVRYVSDHKTSRFSQSMIFDGVDGIVFDITKRKESELELIKAKIRAEINESNSNERVKELQGIFELGQLAEKQDDLNLIYKDFINRIVPSSMRYSNKVIACLKIKDIAYCNRKAKSIPKGKKYLSAKIIVFRKQIGELKVGYTLDLPFDEVHEPKLIKIFGERISYITERNWAQQELKKQNSEYIKLNKKLVKAIEKVEESEKKFRDIFNFIKDSIIVANSRHRIFMANSSTCKLFGYKQDELSELSIKKLFKNERKLQGSLKPIFEGKMSATYDIPMRTKNGSVFFADVSATPLTLNGKHFILCSIRDISERKLIQQKILRTIIETEENERKRVAQELHDGIGPILSTIKLFTETYINSSDESYKSVVSKQLLHSINEALDQISVISSSLSPQILVDFGLRIALGRFIEKLKTISSMQFSFQCLIENRLRSEIEITIYRIVIELINNSLKHSSAKTVRLSVNESGNEVVIVYTDDGVGFDFDKAIKMISGMGLFNIQQRVKSFNGEIDFARSMPTGITYNIRIPLTPE